jgi:hypothetical protein
MSSEVAVSTEASKRDVLPWVIPACFLIGLYAPSSVGGVYSSLLWLAQFVALGVLLSMLLFRRGGATGPGRVANSILLVAALLAATLISPYSDYRWGGLLGYLFLAILYLVNLRGVSAQPYMRVIFLIANVLNLAAGFAIMAGVGRVGDFFVVHYAAFYPELVESMIGLGKPVLTFGTHSVAAFVFYLFFWLSFESYKTLASRKDLVFAISYLVLGFSLLSVSGLILMSLAAGQLLWYFSRRNPKWALGFAAAVCLAAIFFDAHFTEQVENLEDAGSAAGDILFSPYNGFLGRFTELGTLYSTVNYIRAHPLRPVGVGYRSDLFFGDSGPVEHYLRGSILLLLAVYGGLWAFLRQNLVARRDALHLFAVIVLFELGFSALAYMRFLYLLPVVVVYLNDLRRVCAPRYS